jgi:hypothetical protein
MGDDLMTKPLIDVLSWVVGADFSWWPYGRGRLRAIDIDFSRCSSPPDASWPRGARAAFRFGGGQYPLATAFLTELDPYLAVLLAAFQRSRPFVFSLDYGSRGIDGRRRRPFGSVMVLFWWFDAHLYRHIAAHLADHESALPTEQLSYRISLRSRERRCDCELLVAPALQKSHAIQLPAPPWASAFWRRVRSWAGGPQELNVCSDFRRPSAHERAEFARLRRRDVIAEVGREAC